MYKHLAANDAMRRSIGHFEHQGMFSIALNDLLTKDVMKALLQAMGVTGAGTIEQNSRDAFSFTGFLHMRGYVSEDVKEAGYPNYEKTVFKRDAGKLKDAAIKCGFNDIIIACNKWMGLEDENDGITIQVSVASSNSNISASLDTNVKRPPERLSEAINHPKYFTLLTQVYLQLNEPANGEKMKRWQKLMNSFIEMEYPTTQKQRWFSGQSLNPSQELVEFISKKTVIIIPDFCVTIKKLFPELELYTENIMATYHMCQQEFEQLIAEKNENQSEVYNWCVGEGLDFLIPILEKEGFDTLDDIVDIHEDDLEKMGIDKLGHKKKIMRAITKLSGTTK